MKGIQYSLAQQHNTIIVFSVSWWEGCAIPWWLDLIEIDVLAPQVLLSLLMLDGFFFSFEEEEVSSNIVWRLRIAAGTVSLYRWFTSTPFTDSYYEFAGRYRSNHKNKYKYEYEYISTRRCLHVDDVFLLDLSFLLVWGIPHRYHPSCSRKPFNL